MIEQKATKKTKKISVQKPNILLITSDQQRYDSIRFSGINGFIASPNLDGMARGGVFHTEAYTPCPLCLPARVSLVRGVSPLIHGAISNLGVENMALPRYPRLLRNAGYCVAHVGKTHFNWDPEGDYDLMVHINGKSCHSPQHENDDYRRFLKTKGIQWHRLPAEDPEEHLRRHRVVEHDIPEEWFIDAWIADRGVAFIEDAAGKQPFMLHCSMPSPHVPWDAPGSYAGMYRGVNLPRPSFFEGEEATFPAFVRRARAGTGAMISRMFPDEKAFDEPGWRMVAEHYWGLCSFIDAQVGKLLDALDRLGVSDNTLAIFTSDHGEHLGDHRLLQKSTFYDCSVRVPLIARWPGAIPGARLDGFAELQDITATMLSAAGVDLSALPHLDGFDLLPWWRGEAPAPRACVVSAYTDAAMICGRRYKLAYDPLADDGQLFDRESDPREFENLWHNPGFIKQRETLKTLLLRHLGSMRNLNRLGDTTKLFGRDGRSPAKMLARELEEAGLL